VLLTAFRFDKNASQEFGRVRLDLQQSLFADGCSAKIANKKTFLAKEGRNTVADEVVRAG
jgi:hypothetical protein